MTDDKSSATTVTILNGPSLIVSRTIWMALALFCVGYYLVWTVFTAQQPLPECTVPGANCNPFYLGLEDVQVMGDSNLPIHIIARLFFIVNVVTSLVFLVLGGFIFWRKSNDGMALLVSATIIALGAVGVSPSLDALIPPATGLYFVSSFISFFGYFAPFGLLFVFPDGRFVPSWSKYVLIVLIGSIMPLMLNDAIGGDDQVFGTLGNLPFFAIILTIVVGIGCAIYRYRRVATPLQRQQIKWVASGLVLTASTVILWMIYANAFPPTQPSPTRTLAVVFGYPFIAAVIPALPITVAIAIARTRLWDIDILIRRTLQYSLLTGLLALVYFGLVVMLQSLLTAVTGQSSPIVLVLSTLAIAALFSPLRKRVQDFIDRRFYRRKYDAAKTLADFAATARDETDLDKLTARLVEVVDETMQPESVNLWLKTNKK